MRKILSLMLVALLVLTMLPVAFAEGGENVLTIAMETKPNLDLHWNAGSTGAWLMDQMYEGLYRVTETGFELAGATDVTVSEDGTVWTYKLREDAVWCDGQPVTAKDYVYSMQRLVNPAVSSVYMLDYGQFLLNGSAISAGEMDLSELGVTALDDYTLEIKLQDTCTFFDAILCYSAFFPLREDVVEEDGTGNWAWQVERSITNGPMMMVACDEEQEITLVKNPTYYGADSVALDKLVVKLVDDTNTTLQLLESGEVDLITSFPSEEAERMQQMGYYHSTAQLNSSFLLVNVNKEGLSDARVRKALSMAIDREFLATALLMGKTPSVSYIGGGFPGTTGDQDFRSEAGDLFSANADIEGAKALLAEAGYPDGEGMPVIECSYSNSSADNTTVFEYLQACWEELGLTVSLTPLERATMTEMRDAGDFDITNQGWGADYLDASNMLSIFVTGNFINAGRYSSEAFDSAYNKSLSCTDRAERMALLHEAEATLCDEMGTIPLYHALAVALFSDDVVGNVHFNANGKVILTDCVVTE